MTDKKDPNKKHYFKTILETEFAETMQRICSVDKHEPITIWEKGEDEDLAELYIPFDYNSNSKIIKLKPTGKLVTKITGSTKADKQVLVKIPIHDKLNYFSGGILKFHQKDLSYSIELQQDIFKSQARGHFRLNASDVIPMQFKIDEQVFDALDLSTGGTSFLIEPLDRERFVKDKIFTDCTLRFDRKNYYIPKAKVAAQLPHHDSDHTLSNKIKIGITFIDLPRKTEEELYIKISTEARGEEMKKKFDIILAKKMDPT